MFCERDVYLLTGMMKPTNIKVSTRQRVHFRSSDYDTVKYPPKMRNLDTVMADVTVTKQVVWINIYHIELVMVQNSVRKSRSTLCSLSGSFSMLQML